MSSSLKEREIEILKLMAEHQTNREIADDLFISVETVRWYAKQIYAKLHVNSRKQAVQRAIELGLLYAPQKTIETVATLHNLPRSLTRFVGRQNHIDRVQDLLRKHSLVTLTGAGGTGKTRLSIEIAQSVINDFSDGVFFVDLTMIQASEQIPAQIASVLGIREQSNDDTLEIVKRTINDRKLLLLLDNFEHVIDGKRFIGDLLSQTQLAKILVTSREVLQLSGEQVYPVPPLNLQPPKKQEIAEAIELFVERAKLVNPNFQLTAHNQKDIQAICAKVDGLPLAIELLAAHVKIFTPAKLHERLVERWMIPANRLHNIPERHRTIENAIDWSYNQLSYDEKLLFARMSVFQGGRSIEAIAETCMHDLSMDVTDGLLSLVNKSIIQQNEDMLGDPRFTILETLHRYAIQKLTLSDEYDLLKRHHATYLMQMVEVAAPELRQANQEYWFKKIAIEYANLRSAMMWGLSGQAPEIGCRIVVALRDYWWYQGLHEERWYWVEEALNYIDTLPKSVQADLWLSTAFAVYFKGDFEYAGQCGRKALALYESLDQADGVAWSYTFSGIGVGLSMEERAEVDLQAVNMMRDIQNLSGLAMMLNVRGLILIDIEAYDEAITTFEECHAVATQTGEKRRSAIAIGCLGEIALRQERYEEARTFFLESLNISIDLNFVFQLHDLLWMSVAILYHLNHHDDAMTLFGAVRAQEASTGQQIYPLQSKILAQPIQSLQDKYDENSTFHAIYQYGYSLTFEEAVDFALAQLKID